MVKPAVRIINAARGGIVDEQALADALKEGRVAGAGIDVYAKEPCTDSPLFDFESVVVTPHLGASHRRGAGEGRRRRGPVGAPGAGRRARPRRGQRLRRCHRRGGAPRHLAGGEARPHLHRPRRRGAGADRHRRPRRDHPARRQRAGGSPPSRACSRTSSRSRCPTSTPRSSRRSAGCEVRLLTEPVSPDFRNVTTLRGTLADGSVVSVAGTLTGPRLVEKVVAVNGFDLEVPISEHMAFFRYVERPGIVGIVGRVLGDGGRQHRRHAGRARPPGRRGAVRADRRHRHPGGCAGRHRHGHRRQRRQGGRPRRQLSRRTHAAAGGPRRPRRGPCRVPSPCRAPAPRRGRPTSRTREIPVSHSWTSHYR